jgi:hypothetical protein
MSTNHGNGIETYKAALARAAQIAGGVQSLSDLVRVPVADLMRWIRGESKPPMAVFLRVIDILIEDSRKSVFHPLPGEASDRAKPKP